MNNSAAPASAAHEFAVRDFYLGRQPILDANNALFAYELLFRSSSVGGASFVSGLAATAAVIAHAGQLGLDRAIGDALAFLNVDADVLMSDIFAFLPREKVVLELVESVEASDAVLERMGELKGHGFRFALNGVAAITANVERLLPLIDFVKFDMLQVMQVSTAAVVARCRRENKQLMAEKVETRAQYERVRDFGFDYFQGYYFAKPTVIAGRKLTPSQLAVMELMKLVTSDAENIEIERAVKRDVTLAINLLRLVNTPAVGLRHKIDSVSQALIVLGRRQLERWLQILLYADPQQRSHSASPLLMLATTRGKLLELLAKRLRPAQRNVADIAFTVGIMSLMDALFGMKMEVILEQIPVIDEVKDALLSRSGFFGELLKLAEAIEQMDGDDLVVPALKELAISSDELVEFEVAAFSWSDSVAKYAV
ncbi:EAL and HDOD domain-containing protein [Massilia sp. PWRC2]|uniref:EAL and HDOD domain-containing protein n=1 Tax=Massilia sp. PWRC2 TaxID=2804626 RepID=UPI003CF83CD5